MIQFKTIDGLLLRDMIVAGTALLEKNREAVDALNVFPVPDGDTGTNMSLTMQSATREVNSKEFLRADEAANALSKGALKGARGNSGVITSQLLRGFAKALNGVEKITKIMMLALISIMIVLGIRSLTLPGASEGLSFYLKPSFTNMKAAGLGNVFYAALNQSFFTLSLGMGGMEIFGSYIGKERSLAGQYEERMK